LMNCIHSIAEYENTSQDDWNNSNWQGCTSPNLF